MTISKLAMMPSAFRSSSDVSLCKSLSNIILYKRYYTFTAARCVIGFAIAGIESACFVLVMELVGPSKRTLAGIVCWDEIDCGILAFGLKSTTADIVELSVVLVTKVVAMIPVLIIKSYKIHLQND